MRIDSTRNVLNRIFSLESQSRLRSFEGLRAWAIIMVFNVHFFAQYYQQHYFVEANSLAEGAIKFLHAGHIGVDLFFVLSGFLIYSTLERNRPTFRKYIGHRMSRIMPTHVAVLFVLVFPAIPWKGFFAAILFLPTFFVPLPEFNIVTWTLGWEWLFYILMFGIFYSKRGLYVGVASILTILVLATLFFGESYRWGELVGLGGISVILPEPGRFAGFFIGVISAHLLASEAIKQSVGSIAKQLLPMAICGVLFCQFLWTSSYASKIGGSYIWINTYYLVVSACFGVIVTHLATNNTGGLLNSIFQSTFMRMLGQISYSFYLVHALIKLPLAARMVGNVNSFSEMCLHYVAGFLLTTIMATIFFYYFERPYFLAKKNRLCSD